MESTMKLQNGPARQPRVSMVAVRRARTAALALGTILVLGASLTERPAWAGGGCELLIVLDRSGSMSRFIGNQSKMDIARGAITDMMTNVGDGLGFGLAVYPN